MAEARVLALCALLALVVALPAGAVDAPAPAASTATSATVAFQAPTAHLTSDDPALEANMLAITGELRCLVCQNQTIADSHADLAVDLRQQVREMLKRGQTPTQIRRYMTDRYGDFILYRPPLKATTAVLWLAPAALLATALLALALVIRRRARLPDDQFEADPQLDDDSSDPLARPGTPA
ncbi:MAG: cytochrome c-type biogenesis protein [Burkholderiaceae bacterium]